jgi:hypothetical protein
VLIQENLQILFATVYKFQYSVVNSLSRFSLQYISKIISKIPGRNKEISNNFKNFEINFRKLGHFKAEMIVLYFT